MKPLIYCFICSTTKFSVTKTNDWKNRIFENYIQFLLRRMYTCRQQTDMQPCVIEACGECASIEENSIENKCGRFLQLTWLLNWKLFHKLALSRIGCLWAEWPQSSIVENKKEIIRYLFFSVRVIIVSHQQINRLFWWYIEWTVWPIETKWNLSIKMQNVMEQLI